MTRRIISVICLSAAVFTILSLSTVPAHAQNVTIDLSATSGLCGGQECFNTAGIFSNGTTFLGTTGMDNGNNCTPTPPYTNCPDAYSAQQLFGSAYTAGSTTAPSLTLGGVPFNFGPVNAQSCGSTGTACTPDVVNLTSGGVLITLPAAQQTIYSTAIMLGTAVNGHHTGTFTANYSDGTSTVFTQTFSDWCGFGGNQYESIAIPSINRINSNGQLNGASCNLYAYTYPLDYTKTLQSIKLTDTDGSGASFGLAITLKPPTYTIDGGTANPASISPGSQTTATVTINPQPGYEGTVQLACSITPNIVTSASATTPTCSLNPTSVTVTSTETAPPTTTLTFTSAPPSNSELRTRPRMLWAFWLPIPGLALVGIGFKSRRSRKSSWFAFLILGLLVTGLLAAPGCVSTKQLGNVGTPPGQYSIAITGLDENGLSQASNPAGTSNTVTVTISNN